MKLHAFVVLALLSIHEARGFLSRTPSHQRRYQDQLRPASPMQKQEIGTNGATSQLPTRQGKPFWVGGGRDSSLGAAKIIIAGAPASGKGTQCEKIKEAFGVIHLSTGDMLRAAVRAGSEVGREAKSYMDSGKLVPDSTIIGVVRFACHFGFCLLLFCR
jgi:Adenylate kinase